MEQRKFNICFMIGDFCGSYCYRSNSNKTKADIALEAKKELQRKTGLKQQNISIWGIEPVF